MFCAQPKPLSNAPHDKFELVHDSLPRRRALKVRFRVMVHDHVRVDVLGRHSRFTCRRLSLENQLQKADGADSRREHAAGETDAIVPDRNVLLALLVAIPCPRFAVSRKKTKKLIRIKA